MGTQNEQGANMKFTKKSIEALESNGKRQAYFDSEFIGLALRVSEKGHKSFYFTYRSGKGRGVEKKWMQIGAFPTMTCEQARQRAKELAAGLLQGIDPVDIEREKKSAPTMNLIMEEFFTQHSQNLKPHTRAQYRAIIDNKILPVIGKLRVRDVAHRQVLALHHSMRNTPYQGNRVYAVLSVFFNWCEDNDYRPRASNPTAKVKKYKEHKRKEFMGLDKIKVLLEVIYAMEKEWLRHEAERTRAKAGQAISPLMASALRVLIYSGARLNEVLGLKWDYIDFERSVANLPDSKTDYKVLQLSGPAMEALTGLPKISEWCFPSYGRSGRIVNLQDAWRDVLAKANIGHWRIHDLRHAFASTMVNSGASLPIIGAILGHRQNSTTSRYAHLEVSPARQALEQAASLIAGTANQR